MQYNNKNLNIRISQSLLNRVHQNAQNLCMSDSVFVRKALVNFCKYFEKMPLEKFKKYIDDPVVSQRVSDMIEIAKTPWIDIDE